jgi:hypothetical protein
LLRHFHFTMFFCGNKWEHAASLAAQGFSVFPHVLPLWEQWEQIARRSAGRRRMRDFMHVGRQHFNPQDFLRIRFVPTVPTGKKAVGTAESLVPQGMPHVPTCSHSF